jgi:hypothetical protein
MPERLLEIIGWPERFPSFPFDPAMVPENLRPLAPYIEKWVIQDEGVRDTVLRAATTAELGGFIAVVDQIGRESVFNLADKMNEGEIAKEEGIALLYMLQTVEHAESELKKRSHPTSIDDTNSK